MSYEEVIALIGKEDAGTVGSEDLFWNDSGRVIHIKIEISRGVLEVHDIRPPTRWQRIKHALGF
jgi:hypothetical protein